MSHSNQQANCLYDASELERLSSLTTSLVEVQKELTVEMERLTKALTDGFAVGKMFLKVFKYVTTVFLVISLGLLVLVVFITGTRVETKTIKIQPAIVAPSGVQPTKPPGGAAAILPI